MSLSVQNLCQKFGDQVILQDVAFELPEHAVAYLLGGSGSGKTTILRALMGFEPPTSGRIALDGSVLCDSSVQPAVHIPAHERGIGMVFQEHALFSHLTIAQNVAFGLRKWGKEAQKQRVMQLLEMVGLADKAKAYPHQLSGGQQQRVALIRALAPRPKLLLLDEPFSSLDAHLRVQLARDVHDLLKSEQVSAIVVTHDQQEAFAFADYVGVVQNGRIAQWGSPYAVYHEPVSREVAQFIGEGCFIPALVQNEHCVSLELGDFCGLQPQKLPAGERVDVLLRPDDVVHDDGASQTAIIRGKSFRGSDFVYTLSLPSGHEILAQVPSHHRHEIGEAIGVRLDLQHLIAFTQ